MRKILFQVFCLAGLLFLITSCYYDNVADLYPFNGQKCDTTNVTYSSSIAPIMSGSCNICHNRVTVAYGNPAVFTADYNGLKDVAKNGKLWNAVDHLNSNNAKNMPSGGSKLSDCDLAKINIWIKAGYPNN